MSPSPANLSTHLQSRGVHSLGRHAFKFLTDEKKLAFVMGMHRGLAKGGGYSPVSMLSDDIVRNIFALYAW